jgi:hypothetical protein
VRSADSSKQALRHLAEEFAVRFAVLAGIIPIGTHRIAHGKANDVKSLGNDLMPNVPTDADEPAEFDWSEWEDLGEPVG